MHSDEGREGVKVCVTGAGGYIGSWMVKSLLQRGYIVNATFRNPENGAKTEPLLALSRATERLRLFKADLCEEGTFESAVEGCDGVFHLASPMVTSNHLHEEDYVEPAVKGVLNVLNTCLRAKSARRVAYTSSVAAACLLNEEGELISGYYLDESRWTPVDFLRKKQHHVHFYYMAKTVSEQAAIEYGLNNQMEVVTIGPGYVVEPDLLLHFPSHAQKYYAHLQPRRERVYFCFSQREYKAHVNARNFAGDYQGLRLNRSLLGSIPFIHVDDVCEYHIFLMEQPNVQGRHICSACSFTTPQLAYFIRKRYPQFASQVE